jgi:di/tricarboxylate transporter
LFVIGGALEKVGAIDQIGRVLKRRVSGKISMSILAFSLVAAFFSAWMNNTAIVAILMPVVLGFARSKDIPASKLLIPLSYSSILGGCCTLIGTSTNLIVNGSLKELGLQSMGMFTLAPIGIPVAMAGIGYMVIFGSKLLPSRSSITGSLEIDLRTIPLHHLLIGEGSSLIGKRLLETALGRKEAGIHVLEVRRRGARLMIPLSELVIEKNDRFLVALHRRNGGEMKAESLFIEIGAQELSAVDGIVSELVVPNESTLVGKTLAASDFRQRYNCVVLAVHRNGLNITSRMAELDLDRGDTLLVITAVNNLPALKATRDFVLTDTPEAKDEQDHPKVVGKWPILAVWGVLGAVVLTVSITDVLSRVNPVIPSIPIHYAAIVGVLLLLWSGLMTPREAYESIDWQVLLMLYGLLGLGLAMENTGTTDWLAMNLVNTAKGLVSPDILPFVMLWLVFLMTLLLTEILSNNATAVMLVPVVVELANQMGVDYMPYVIVVTIAASCAFMMPMGYQTHMMVYGPGGYRFSDYIKFGLPLNVITWIVTCSLVLLIWAF